MVIFPPSTSLRRACWDDERCSRTVEHHEYGEKRRRKEILTGLLPLSNVVDGYSVQQTVDSGASDDRSSVESDTSEEGRNVLDDGNLQRDGKGLVLTLLEELSETGSSVKEETGGGIEIGSELGERGDISVLGQVELERSSDGLHDLWSGERRQEVISRTQKLESRGGRTDLGLSGGTDSGYGKSDVDSRSYSLEEELGLSKRESQFLFPLDKLRISHLEEDLSIAVAEEGCQQRYDKRRAISGEREKSYVIEITLVGLE